MDDKLLPEQLRENIAILSDIISEKMGLNFPPTRYAELSKKMQQIAHAFNFDDIAECIQWIKSTPFNREKMEILSRFLTVGETYFFRDKHLFTMLQNYILPELIKLHERDRSLRIWCAGCSSGEEVYSLAILISQMIPDLHDWKIHLIGTDINKDLLNKAKHGKYQKWSFRATPEEIKKNYFIKDGTSYTVIPSVKKMVGFFELNLVDNSYPDPSNGTSDLDLIICHNVLIYFTQPQIKKVIHQLSRSLTENGWLSVTAIEVPFVDDESLSMQKLPWTIFTKSKKKKRSPSTEHKPILNLVKPSQPQIELKQKIDHKPTIKKALPKNIPTQKSPYEDCLKQFLIKDYKSAADNLLQFIVPLRKNAPKLKEHLKEVELLIRTYANQGDVENALEWCEEILHHEKLDPLLHYWHGALLEAKGNFQEASKAMKRTLFIDPHFVMAHYVLGELEKAKGNLKSAKKSFETALELINNSPDEDIVPGTEELNYAYLRDILKNSLNNHGAEKHASK